MNNKIRKPPKIAQLLLSRLLPGINKNHRLGDFEETYNSIREEAGLFSAYHWYWLQVLDSLPGLIWNSIFWSFVMFKNYVKITLRNLRKHWGYSIVNITGLALGMACCTLISFSVLDEIYFNTFHENTDRIFCAGNYQTFEGNVWHITATPALLGPAIEEEFPEVVAATRYTGFGQALVRYKDKSFFENRVYHVDPSFLNIFTYPLISGDKNSALDDPHSVVISENMAEKYFPGEDPLGKIIQINNEYDLTVTGVVKNVPYNSMLRFEMLLPFKFREEIYRANGRTFSWSNNNPRTYMLLQDQSMEDAVRSKIKNFVREKSGQDGAPEFTIIPMKKIRFTPFGGGERRKRTMSIYSLIASIILLIACINFMNLSTARSANRAKEIGLRKVVGACRKNVIFQFLGESMIISLCAMILAVIFVILMLPMFNTLFNKNLPLSVLTSNYVLPVLTGITLITGIIGGSYPAFFLSSFRPVTTLKGDLRSGTKSVLLRKSLVIFQFVLSISLIICTVVIYKQIDFIKNKDMGFDTENIIYIPLRAGASNSYTALKNNLTANPGVESVTSAAHKPTGIRSNTYGVKWEGQDSDYDRLIHFTYIEYDYVKTLDLELKEGRDFSKQFPSDTASGVLVNEEFVREMGKESVVGTSIEMWGKQKRIIGVIKDFHFIALNDLIPPLIIRPRSEDLRYLMARINPENISSTLGFIKETWETVLPGYPFEYNFFDAEFDRNYSVETGIANVVKSFAVIGILIACLGLFGLASFTAEQRTKEIGIRKVLGASVPKLMNNLTKEFVVLVIAANIVAWPVSYYIMNNWLESFAYKTNINLWTLVFPALIAVVLTIFTVSYQAAKAARSNPVESLKYE